MIGTLLYLLFVIAFIYSFLSVTYLFIFAFAGRFFYNKRYTGVSEPQKRIAVLVPAYKEDGIMLSTGKSLLALDYPRELYDVYLITDSFKPETLQVLRELPLHVFEVSFDKSTKTKSLNEAFSRITKPYDIALICDADNILAKDFLKRLNTAFIGGAKAVQGRRVAKNLDSSFAILDACSEGINNNIFRKGANALGLSSSVIGSGMAFEYAFVKQALSEISAVGGFDKILQLKVVQHGISIQYLQEAIVFDEKVDSSQAFKQQRKRWVSSQFIYLKQFFLPSFKQLFKGNVSYFNLGIASNLILPRAFLFIILPLLVVAGFLFTPAWGIASVSLWLLFALTLVMALPSELINKDLLSAIGKLPKAISVMLGTVIGMKSANKTFIHTVHTKTKINNPLFNEQGNQ
jgi:cellulose synthase/poly-beta-1,6-N-acetylglucosamine synthase-like glycosyltransferase